MVTRSALGKVTLSRSLISSALDNVELAVGIFSDLLKDFNTVDHSILFDKLEHYGMHGLALKWIKSYNFLKQTSICRIMIMATVIIIIHHRFNP